MNRVQVDFLPPFPLEEKTKLFFLGLNVAKRIKEEEKRIVSTNLVCLINKIDLDPDFKEMREEFEKRLPQHPNLAKVVKNICLISEPLLYSYDPAITNLIDFYFGKPLMLELLESSDEINDKEISLLAYDMWAEQSSKDIRYRNCSNYFWQLARNHIIRRPSF